MGLDVLAYSKLTPVEVELDENGDRKEYNSRIVNFYKNHPSHDRSDGLDTDKLYQCEDYFSFKAGSYSGYNHWRNQLAILAGYDGAEGAWEAADGDFWELINFSDCEGTIGSETSKKLLADFEAFQSKADEHEDQWFKQRYENFKTAFELASDGGAVKFT